MLEVSSTCCLVYDAVANAPFKTLVQSFECGTFRRFYTGYLSFCFEALLHCTIVPVFRVQSTKTGECVSTHKSFIRRVQLITTGHRVMSLLNRGVKSMQNSRNKVCIRETNYKLFSTLMHRIMVVMDVFRTFYEQKRVNITITMCISVQHNW